MRRCNLVTRCLVAILVVCALALRADPPASTDAAIKALYQRVPHQLSHKQRLNWFSQQLLGKPYQLEPLGEGKGHFDADPRYRIDAFDCQTYVETSLALSLANDLASFRQYLQALRYKSGKPSFITRHHFVSVDWNPNNVAEGFIRELTTQLVNPQGKPIFVTSEAEINFQGWIRGLLAHRPPAKNAAQRQRISELALLVPTRLSRVNYLALSDLFDKEGHPKMIYFDQIPSGSVVEIVRPNWQLKDKIGTNLQISHMGLVVRNHHGALVFRNASSIAGKVIDVPLTQYLSKQLASPTIKGIAVYSTETSSPLLSTTR